MKIDRKAMSKRRFVDTFQTSLKTLLDASFNTVVGTIDGFGEKKGKLKRSNSGKIDAVRRAFKYESLVYHGWRSLWCTYVTIIAFYNFLRMRNEFSQKYDSSEVIPYHSHYDRKTSWDITMVVGFFLIDLLIYVIRRKFMTRSVIVHHLVGIILGCTTLFTKYPHHYHANLFMCAEIVSCLTVLSHYAKKSRSKTLYKIYLAQYLVLTIFGRGWIWYTVLMDLMISNVSFICYFGFVPLILMDVIWSRQCYQGLMK